MDYELYQNLVKSIKDSWEITTNIMKEKRRKNTEF